MHVFSHLHNCDHHFSISTMEPQTTAKVVLNTTKGPIEAELFAKEVPLACTRFLQLCKAGYYDSKPFYRVLPGELIQCGQPEAGKDTDSYPKLKDEPHTRIKLKRGYLAMASEYTDNNRRVPNSATTEFFVALKEIPFSGTVIGKITGDTIYNAQDIARGELTEDGYPMYVQRVETVEIVLGGGLVEETGKGEVSESREIKARSNDKSKKPKRKLQVNHDDDEEEEPVFTKKSVFKLVEDKFKKETKEKKKAKLDDSEETRPDTKPKPTVEASTVTHHVQDEEADAAAETDDVVSERLEKFKNMARDKPEPAAKSVLISREDRIRRRLGLGPEDDVPSDASDPSSDEDDDDFDIFTHKFICPEDEKGEDSLVTLGA